MASFSSSQLSDMISRKRYDVRRSDTLSELAESFMNAFPTLKRFSRSNVEDMIFNENSSNSFKDRNKSFLIEGKSLELKFILEARRREFKFDHSAKEYVFTDEDRLAFALNESEFWDHFCRCDRDCGEFLRESLKEQGLSSLPRAISLNHKISGSCCHKDLMSNVKREIGSFKKVIKLDLISEKILKIIGYNSPSSVQISDLSKNIIEENCLNTCNHEKCTCVSLNQIERLSTKCVEECYCKAPLDCNTINDLKKGIYKVSIFDKIIFAVNKDLFWKRIYKHSDDKKINEEARKGVGLSMNSLEGDKIFVATKAGIDQITVSNKPGVSGTTSTNNITRLKIIGLYANHLANSNVIKTILISDVARTPIEQAGYIHRDALNYPNINDTNAMYDGYIGKLTREWIQEGLDTQEITNRLTNYITVINPDGFRHISSSNDTIDIAANVTRDTADTNFNKSFKNL